MGNALLVLLGAARAAEGECPGRLEQLDLLDAAERATVEADLATADEKLRLLEAAFSCGTLAEPELLGRMWLVEGAWLELQGDSAAAAESWRAAQRIAPGRWAEDFGTKLRGAYETANRVALGAPSLVTVDPPLFRWIGAIDGTVVQFPASVPPGLHLVQVGPDEDHIQFSRILLAFANTPSVVVTGLVEPTSGGAAVPEPVAVEPAPEAPPEREPRDPGRLALHAAVGADAVVGRPPEGASPEPGFKLLVPVETGFVVRPSLRTWVRAAASAAPFVNGAFVYDDGAGESPTALGFHLAGGFAADQGDMGLLLGYQWPGRIAVRGVLAGALGRSPFGVEGRVGLNAATGGPPEPAFGVVLAFVPRVIDLPEPEAEPL